jgi:hypothetical protein
VPNSVKTNAAKSSIRVNDVLAKRMDEILRTEIYASGAELQDSLTDFSDHYNNHRPHRCLGLKSPKAFREGLTTNQEAETLTLKAGQEMGTSHSRKSVVTRRAAWIGFIFHFKTDRKFDKPLLHRAAEQRRPHNLGNVNKLISTRDSLGIWTIFRNHI